MSSNDKPAFDHVLTYSRKDAIADGSQVEVTTLASEAGIKYPVFLTYAVHSECVEVLDGAEGQDETGRLWDLLNVLRSAILTSGNANPLPFALVRNDGRIKEFIRLVAVCGPLDVDDPKPALTVMFPDED